MSGYTVDVWIPVDEEDEISQAWWEDRFAWASERAGGMPPEVDGAWPVALQEQVDPDTGEQFVRVTLRIAPGTGEPRTRELSHMLTSVLIGMGYTMRLNGKAIETIPGAGEQLEGTLGEPDFLQARASAGRCLTCIFASETRIGCCGQGAAFSLADIGASLLAGEEQFVRDVLALPGEMDGVKWQPYLAKGVCTFHDPSKGCTLPPERMPMQCRVYLCYPEQLLPPAMAAEYPGYVEALEEAESFIEEHMKLESGVDFDSPLDDLKHAAAKAFAAWEAGKKR